MTRTLTTVSAVLMVMLMAATPAHASLADWLDKLGEMSGPGPWIQRVGVAFDFACVEGQWWKDPAIDRQVDDSVDFELQVAAALGSDQASDPFKTAAVIRQLLTRAGRSPEPSPDLIRLFESNRNATLRILRQRARTQFWMLRERIFAAKGQPIEEVLRANGYDPDALAQDAAFTILKDSLKIAFNPFCVGDLRKHRLSVGAYTAWFTTDTVPATYAYTADKAALSPRINAYPLAATFTTSLPFVTEAHPAILRSWDLGLSVGAIRFQSEDNQRFDGFWLGPYVEFPRIRLRPLAAVACHVRKGNCPGQWTGWDLLEVELVRKWLPDYERQQFGALSGETSGRDGQWWVRIGVAIKFNDDQTPDRLVP